MADSRNKYVSKKTVLAVGTLLMIFIGLIYAWSIFRAPLGEMFPAWTVTQISMTFTISMVCFCTGGLIAGKLASVFMHKAIIIISASVIFIGFISLSFLLSPDTPERSLVLLYIFYGVFGGLGVGLSYNTLLGVVLRHYSVKSGMASGLLLVGFGIGGITLGSIVNNLNESIGINKTFLVLGCIMGAVLFAGSYFIKLPSKRPDLEDGIYAGSESDEVKSYSLAETIRLPIFWAIVIWDICMCIGGLLVVNSAVPIAVHFGMIAVLGLIISVFNGAGRFILGVVLDAIGCKTAMLLNSILMLLGGASLLLGSLTFNPVFIYIGLPVIGTSFGGAPTLFAVALNSAFGPKNYQIILGAATYSVAVGAIIGPLISSKLQEASGGEYTTSFLMVIAAAAAAILFSIIMRDPERFRE